MFLSKLAYRPSAFDQIFGIRVGSTRTKLNKAVKGIKKTRIKKGPIKNLILRV